MPLHQVIQRVLLIGAHVQSPPPPPPPAPTPPAVLTPLIQAIHADHRLFDRRALHFGNRYRSGFWTIYLLSAVAVLCAVLPLALGWDSGLHPLHSYAGLWAIAEVLVISSVAAIYWRGHRGDWQGQWLRARTTAELAWYLPMLAPLLDWERESTEPNWYLRVFNPGSHVRAADDIGALCLRNESMARGLLANAWAQPAFIAGYAGWTMSILAHQQHYHLCQASKQHALMHRVHRINAWLFGLTALGATLHLVVHTIWLSVITTFFPALGASLHGALAQSEAHRLGTTSERLARELQGAIAGIQAGLDESRASGDATSLRKVIENAIALLLEEHQDWNLMVRPHHLPLG
ncbi:MAG TPA: hypothetical protein VGN07_22370 [Steroidobacteraceae bacterium]